MGRTTKKAVQQEKHDATNNGASRPGKDTQGTDKHAAHEYKLTDAHVAKISEQIQTLGEEETLASPGRLHHRVRWATRIRIAAERDADELIQAPFFGEPPLTKEEIAEMRDRIEMVRAAESRFQQARAERKVSSAEFDVLSAEAAGHKDLLLRTFDLRFRNDPQGQKVLVKIREGEGDADLVQDVSDIVTLCQDHEEYLASCPRGEGAAAKRLAEISPRLTHLLGAKTLEVGSRPARKVRDGAYTLMVNTERRIRAAAEYWYGGTEKMKEYAPYVAPSGAAKATDDDEPADPAAPADNTVAPRVAVTPVNR